MQATRTTQQVFIRAVRSCYNCT